MEQLEIIELTKDDWPVVRERSHICNHVSDMEEWTILISNPAD